jgi:drug/metabolite transporter (DMT)-like permease
VIAFVTYHWLLKRIEAVYLSLTTFINPVIAVILGAIVLGETLSPMVFAGSGLVLAGILAANGKQLYGKVRARL